MTKESGVVPEIEVVYERVKSDWHKLAKYFPDAKTRPIPKIMMISSATRANLGDYSGKIIDQNGARPINKEENWTIAIHVDRTINGNIQYSGRDGNHIIYIDSNLSVEESSFVLALTEAETYAATHNAASGLLEIKPRVIKNFKGIVSNFGDSIADFLQRINQNNPSSTIHIKTFFAPIGQLYLLGEDFPVYKDWYEVLGKMSNVDKEKDWRTTSHCINFLGDNLPRLAGEMLIRSYNGDLEALLSDHPDIFALNKEELWYEYCIPILTKGAV